MRPLHLFLLKSSGQGVIVLLGIYPRQTASHQRFLQQYLPFFPIPQPSCCCWGGKREVVGTISSLVLLPACHAACLLIRGPIN